MLHHELCKWWGTVAFRKWWGTVALAYSSVAFARPLRAQFFSDFSGATLNPGQLRNQFFEAVPSESLPGILSAGAFFLYAKPMPMRTQKLVSSVTVLARGAMARPAPRARSARAADGGLGSRAAGHGVAGVAHGHAVAAAHAVAMAAHGVAGVVAAVAAVGAAYGT